MDELDDSAIKDEIDSISSRINRIIDAVEELNQEGGAEIEPGQQ